MRRADRDGTLAALLDPRREPRQREVARIEGWILACPRRMSYLIRLPALDAETGNRSCFGGPDPLGDVGDL
jgi:hypothetical protein